MHKMHHRRVPQGLGAEAPHRRQGAHLDDGGEGYVDRFDTESGFFLPGPLTKSAAAPPISVEAYTLHVVRTTSTIVTVETSPPATEGLSSRAAAPIDDAAKDNSDAAAGATVSRSITPGAVAGIVLAIVAVAAGIIIFLVRRCHVRRRLRMRQSWANSKSLDASTEPKQSQDHGMHPLQKTTTPIYNRFVEQQYTTALGRGNSARSNRATDTFIPSGSPPTPPLAPPPASYGNESAFMSNAHSASSEPFGSPPVASSPIQKILTPAYGPATVVTSRPSSVAVVSTFIPSLPDELNLAVGENVRVVAEFDDGWVMCVNHCGEQGLVPLQCLDLGEQPDADSEPGHGSHDKKANRMSSLLSSPRFSRDFL